MITLLNKRPKGEIKCNALEVFKDQMKQIEQHLNYLEMNIDLSSEKLTNHCEMVRNQIEIKSGNIIQNIEIGKTSLLKEVDNFETQCKNNITERQHNILKVIQENTQVFQQYNHYIKEQNIDENDLVKMRENATIQSNSLILTKDKIKNFDLFNGNRIKFIDCKIDQKIDLSAFGTIIYEPVTSFDFTRYTGLIELNTKMESFERIIQTATLENGKVIILYIDSDGSECLSIFDKSFNFIKSSKVLSIKNINIPKYFVVSSICKIENKILISFINIDVERFYFEDCLVCLDDNFCFKKSIKCNEYSSICGDAGKVITFYNKRIDIYDKNLEYLKTLCLDVGHCVENSIIEVQMSNKRIFLRYSNEIKIINFNSGVFKASIDVNSYQMILNNNKLHLVVFKEYEQVEFQVYDFNGELETKYSLIGFTEDCLVGLLSLRANRLCAKFFN
jgi:hypothetical protein